MTVLTEEVIIYLGQNEFIFIYFVNNHFPFEEIVLVCVNAVRLCRLKLVVWRRGLGNVVAKVFISLQGLCLFLAACWGYG